jgi:ribonuclease D
MLRRRKDMHPDAGNWIELQDYVTRFGMVDKSLQRIYANLFGEKISKSQRLSNWEAENLTEAQQLYAAIDAWACVKIYLQLQELERSGDYELIKNQPIQQITKTDEL